MGVEESFLIDLDCGSARRRARVVKSDIREKRQDACTHVNSGTYSL